MTTLDGSTIAALIAIGALLFLTGWRMGAASRRRAFEIAARLKHEIEQGDDPIEFHADAKGVSPRRDPATKELPRYRRPF